MHILLTAFEPFGSNVTNITQEVLNELPEQIGENHLHKIVLPVSFAQAPIVLCEAIERLNPDCVLMLGQCKEGEKIRLERYAHNMMDSQMGDNDHYCPNEEIIYPHSPTALMTTIGQPLKTIEKTLTRADRPVTITTSAGLYVCNRVYYEALYLNQKALFIHIPKTIGLYVAGKTLLHLIRTIILVC